jgi:hypothetical protein
MNMDIVMLRVYLGVGSQLPYDGEGQALHPRVEGAQLLAQQPGQHGHHLLHQVVARAALAGLMGGYKNREGVRSSSGGGQKEPRTKKCDTFAMCNEVD